MDEIARGVGYVFIVCVGGGAVVLALACMCIVVAGAFAVYSERLFRNINNWHAVYQWDKNGRPEFRQNQDGVFVMTPTRPLGDVK